MSRSKASAGFSFGWCRGIIKNENFMLSPSPTIHLRRSYPRWLLPRLLLEVSHKTHQLGRRRQHFLTKPLSILADLESRMKLHHFHRIPDKLFVLGERGEGLPQGRYRLRRRARRHHGHPAHVSAGDIRRLERVVLDPRGRLAENLRIDLGKRAKLGKIRTALQHPVGAE